MSGWAEVTAEVERLSALNAAKPALTGPMEGPFDPVMLRHLQRLKTETNRALDAVQVGRPVPTSLGHAVQAVLERLA